MVALALAGLTAGCAAPPAPTLALTSAMFAIERTQTPAAPSAGPAPVPDVSRSTVLPVSVSSAAKPAFVKPPGAVSESDDSPAPAVGGTVGGASGVSAPPAPAPRGFLLVNGASVPVADADEVPLPSVQAGQVSLFIPGRVPSSLVLDGSHDPPATHPRADTVSDPFAGQGLLTGLLSPALGGVLLRFISADRSTFADAVTPATVAFSVTVPVARPTKGILVALEPGPQPRLGVVSAVPAPGTTLNLGSLPLVNAGPDEPPAPQPPAGLALTGAELRLADAGGPGVALPIFATTAATLPSYPLPGARFELAYRAANADSTQSSEVCGPEGQVPGFLTPPDLAGLPATVSGGTHLSWPAVTGATLYTLSLTRANIIDPPVWEGATASSAIDLPNGLALAGQALRLHLDAWDATGVSIYSVAGLKAPRQLHLPADPMAVSGRHAAALRVLQGG